MTNKQIRISLLIFFLSKNPLKHQGTLWERQSPKGGINKNKNTTL